MSRKLEQKLESLLNTGELLELVDSSYSNSEILRKLSFSVKGLYISVVKDFLVKNEIDYSHFISGGVVAKPDITRVCPVCSKSFTRKAHEKEQVTCSYSCSNTYFRSGNNNPNWKDASSNYRIKALKHYGTFCSRCGFSNILALEVHHKDRDRANNNIDNLEVLCANCHVIEHKNN